MLSENKRTYWLAEVVGYTVAIITMLTIMYFGFALVVTNRITDAGYANFIPWLALMFGVALVNHMLSKLCRAYKYRKQSVIKDR